MRRQLQSDWRIIIVYLFLLAAGIPWYWPRDNNVLLLGMPAWVTIAVIVSLIASILTAIILVTHRWPGESDESEEPGDR